MYLFQSGDVLACCQNHNAPLGNVGRQTLREIWASAEAQQLRSALAVGDYSMGCEFCEWEVRSGQPERVFAREFDRFADGGSWPRQMEFALTNTCNLQCVMCNGDFSSSIRSQREHRAPLPSAFGDAFFEQLVEFLPHLEVAKFFGGEPFLGSEPLRVMDLLVEHNPSASVIVNTNATIWTPRVRRITDALPISFVVSLDAATKDTFEAIRVGASFDQVMANLDRFDEAAERQGTSVSIAHCLMTSNWHEFADLLVLAEGRGYVVGVNVVLFPMDQSLYQLPPNELATVIEGLEQQGRTTARALTDLRPVFDTQVEALRTHLDGLLSSEVSVRVSHDSLRSDARTYAFSGGLAGELAAWGDADVVCEVRCDGDDRITVLDPASAVLVGEPFDGFVGQPVMALFARFQERFGTDVRSQRSDDTTFTETVFRRGDGSESMRIRTAIQPDPEGEGTVVLLAWQGTTEPAAADAS